MNVEFKTFSNFFNQKSKTQTRSLEPNIKKSIKKNNKEISDKIFASKLLPLHLPEINNEYLFEKPNKNFKFDLNKLLDNKNEGWKTTKEKENLEKNIDKSNNIKGFLTGRNDYQLDKERKSYYYSDERDLSHLLDYKRNKNRTTSVGNLNILKDNVKLTINEAFYSNFINLLQNSDENKNYLDIKWLEKPILRLELLDELSKISVASEKLDSEESKNKQFLKKLIEDLHKDHPNVFSNSPSGRQEVLLLRNWISQALKLTFQDKNLSKSDRFIVADDLFSICINELIRQISIECMERGELLLGIWKSYFALFNNISDIEAEKRINLKKKNEEELEKIKNDKYKIVIDKKIIIEDQANALNNLTKEIDNLKKELIKSKQVEKIEKETLLKMKNSQEKLYKTIKKITNENNELRKRLNHYLDKDSSKEEILSEESEKTNSDLENEIYALLGDNTKNNDKNKEIDNPIIVKCYNDAKEKILLNKETQIELDIIKDFIFEKSVQSELNLLDIKYDEIMNIDKLEDMLNEQIIKKNIMHFSEKNMSLTSPPTKMQKKGSVVMDILNTLSPKKTKNLFSFKNADSLNSSKNSSYSNLDEIIAKNNENNENNEIVEFQVEIPKDAKTFKEKRNSILIEITKKIEESDTYSRKSKFSEKKLDDKKLSFHLDNEISNFELNKLEIGSESKINEKNIINNPIKEMPKEEQSSPYFTNTSVNSQSPSPLINSPKNTKEILIFKKRASHFEAKSTKEIPLKENELKELSQTPEKTKILKPKLVRNPSISKLKLSNLNLINQRRNSNNNNLINENFSKTNISSKSPKNQKSKNEKLNFSDMNSIQNSNLPRQRSNINKLTSNVNLNEQAKMDYLSEYLNNIDSLIENKGNENFISIKLPKQIVSKLKDNDATDQNNEEIEIKDKLIELINVFQIENQKTELLLKEKELLKDSINKLIDLIKKVFAILKGYAPDKYDEFLKMLFEIRGKIPKNIDSAFDNDIKEQLIKKRIIKKARNITKFFLVPKLGAYINKANIIDKENNPGMVITRKIKEIGTFKNKSKLIHIKQVMKTITQLYDEKIQACKDNSLNKEMELQIFSFQVFLNRYGMKKVAERKFTEFSLSVKNNIHIFRVNIFARMLNILDSKLNYSIDEMKKYIEGLEYLVYHCNSGFSIIHDPNDIKRYIPYIRCLDYLRIFSENKFTHEEIKELKAELEIIKENDPKNINKTGIVDMDIFLSKYLIRYRHLMNRTKTYVVNAFNAADLDGNKMCNLAEFVLLYRHIENEKFIEQDVIKLFEEQADIVLDSKKNMSFDKFTAICVDFQLFSDDRQIKYIGIDDQEENINNKIDDFFKSLNVTWIEKKIEIENKLKLLENNLEKEDLDNWYNILKTLEVRVKIKGDFVEKKPILIAYKIMFDELCRLEKKKEEEEEFEEIEIYEEQKI